jgi:hypothetical protein
MDIGDFQMKVYELFESNGSITNAVDSLINAKEKSKSKFDKYASNDLFHSTDKEVSVVKSADHFTKVIRDNCSEILKAYETSGKILYRGIYAYDREGIITAIRPDRKPVEMRKDLHELLHLAFLKAGLKATRKNSIFCTTSPEIADDWGQVYVIFPKDGWKATIFETHKKDYTFYAMSNMKYEINDWTAPKDQIVDTLVKSLKNMEPMAINNSTEMAHVLSEGYEDILLTGNSYIAVKVPLARRALKMLNIKTNIPKYD